MASHDLPDTPSPLPEDSPSPSTPDSNGRDKFNWLKHQRARNNPFVKARPSLTRESSTAELFSRENSSSDFFQNSRLNLFETTAPKPEVSQGFKKVNNFSSLNKNFKIYFSGLHLQCCSMSGSFVTRGLNLLYQLKLTTKMCKTARRP